MDRNGSGFLYRNSWVSAKSETKKGIFVVPQITEVMRTAHLMEFEVKMKARLSESI